MIVCSAIAAVVVASALGAFEPLTEQADAEIWLPTEVASAFEDRTGLTESAAGPLASAMEHVAGLSVNELRDAAERHATSRLVALKAVSGSRTDALSAYDDLMRFPQASRGEPVSLVGVIRTRESLVLDGFDSRLVRCVPLENPAGMVAVLVPAAQEIPPVGERIQLIGVFVKLAELPATDQQPSLIAPLIVAPSISAVPRSEDAEPDPSQWSSVKHQTLGVRAAEKDLYYQVLKHAADADVTALQAAAREQVAQRLRERPALQKREAFPIFEDVFRNPSAYEGRPVTLKGHAREVRKYPAGSNAEGLETLYEAWIYTDDSQSNPAVIVATSASPDLPIGDDLQVPIEATGYFFKIYGYRAHDTTRVAPMILAGRIERLPEPVAAGAAAWLLAILAAVFAALFGWLLVSYFGTRRSRLTRCDVSPDFTVIRNEDDSRE